jgi:hypothetical protein
MGEKPCADPLMCPMKLTTKIRFTEPHALVMRASFEARRAACRIQRIGQAAEAACRAWDGMNPAGKVRCYIMPIARGYRRDLESLQRRSLLSEKLLT